MRISGIQAFLEILSNFGVRHIFGNPGTTELPLNDALVGDKRFQYILGLQEIPVMAMADGFAMASQSLAVVNLHICCGLGNAMGMLYNAFREGTPLLVTAGQQDRRLMFDEPILWGDMVAVARPWTKWAVEVSSLRDLPNALRRAAQIALTPPTGPVFMSLPMDLQMELVDGLDMSPIRIPDSRVRPPIQAVQDAARVLLEATNPGILAGSRVTERQAMADLVAMAELLGAPVMSESGTTHGRLAFPSDHPLNGQGLPLWAPEVRERLKKHDVLLVTGMDLLRLYVYFEPARAIPEHIRLVHIDESPSQIGKNYPVEVGVLGDTKESLHEIAAAIKRQLTPALQISIRDRSARHAGEHEASRAAFRGEIERQRALRPLTSLTLMGALAKVLPDNIAVVEEAVTTTNTTFERLGVLKNTTGYFGHRGWALGWGLGCAIGVKIAWPDRPVLALLGEGAATYGIVGLWSAAHYRIPVTFVICNNAQYQILKIGAKGVGLRQALQDRFVGMDLVGPEIDYVSLAQSLGVESVRVSSAEELTDRVAASWSSDRPVLFDVPIVRDTPARLAYG